MTVTKLTNPAVLFNPDAPTPPLLTEAKKKPPLTQRSYEKIQQKHLEVEKSLLKRQQQFAPSNSNIRDKLKLGFLLERSKIPRAIGLKMTDLTESYSQQMWALIEAAGSIENNEEEPYGPELEGVFEKSREMAKRFQQAMEEIENCYALLRHESRDAVINAINEVKKQTIDENTKQLLLAELLKRYDIENKFDLDQSLNLVNKEGTLTSKLTLLPLLKGRSVYDNKIKTLSYLKLPTVATQVKTRPNKATTKAGTTIEMLYQVQPKFETSVFSDHAGFVASFSTFGCKPLFVYYHSLEHGSQHTNTRTAWNYGSHSSLNFAVLGKGKLKPDESTKLSIHNPRDAFLTNFYQELNVLLALAQKNQGNVLVVIGECTLSIHEGLLVNVLKHVQSPTDWKKISPVSENSVNVHGAPTQHPDFDLRIINASKGGKVKKNSDEEGGLGVHALMGYLFLNTKEAVKWLNVEASMLTLGDNTTQQNLLTLTYGPFNELHAFTHLLNKKEDLLADELKKDGYVTVGGDLNNITLTKRGSSELVETIDRKGDYMSSGSNSTVTKMYDKIVVL